MECGQCTNPYPTRTACRWDHTQVGLKLALSQHPKSSWQQTRHLTPFAVPNVTIYLWATVLTNRGWLTHPTHECDTQSTVHLSDNTTHFKFFIHSFSTSNVFFLLSTWSCAWDILNPVTQWLYSDRYLSNSEGRFGLQSRYHFLFRLFCSQETDRSRHWSFPTFFG